MHFSLALFGALITTVLAQQASENPFKLNGQLNPEAGKPFTIEVSHLFATFPPLRTPAVDIPRSTVEPYNTRPCGPDITQRRQQQFGQGNPYC